MMERSDAGSLADTATKLEGYLPDAPLDSVIENDDKFIG